MATKSDIEWTESTWNPVTGCTKISAGCENCYAERMARRLKAMGQPNYRNGFEVTCHPHMLDVPARWKTPQIVFVNSMSDLFHERVPAEFIRKVFGVMNEIDRHIYQVLTKRSERLVELDSSLPWQPQIWMGVTVENADYLSRIDELRDTAAHTKFVSFEPLIGAIDDVNLDGVDWAIVGGESGPGARPMDPDWARRMRDICAEQEVWFFFKQWGGTNKKKAGRVLDDRTWEQMPPVPADAGPKRQPA
ncbi:MAG: phage Gp37/Gp68 family protein [Planctomycetota bacterium]